MAKRKYNGIYRGENLEKIAFPLGGMGAGMICLEGPGGLTSASLHNHMDFYNEPYAFAALCVKGSPNVARVLEGPVPRWKVFGLPGTGNGGGGKSWGLPRFRKASFQAKFPFAEVKLEDDAIPLKVRLTGWSPFVPNDADASGLPVAGLEYTFRNPTDTPVEAVFSYQAGNFLAIRGGKAAVTPIDGGFVLAEEGSEAAPHAQAAMAILTDAKGATADCCWFRGGGWFDSRTVMWRTVERGECISNAPPTAGPPSPGGSLYVPLNVAPGKSQTLRVMLCWYAPRPNLRVDCHVNTSEADGEKYRPHYAVRFADIGEVAAYWRKNYTKLRRAARRFSRCFYDTTLPDEVIEAVAANLTILKSPTVLRQADGRLWGWEGCCDERGCCAGSCTHVWNYAQAICHLFADMERTLRRTEFFDDQDDRGHQDFRANLPVRPTAHKRHAAADGQFGGIMKVYREWRISGDDAWLKEYWPRVRASLDYCIATWDPDRRGALFEPHHNTYDIEFWGADGMCTSFYHGALAAAVAMGKHLGDDVSEYEQLLARSKAFLEGELFNGEYFIQNVQWRELHAESPITEKVRTELPELAAMIEREGPKYQYGNGCLSDGVLGVWLAEMCGLSVPLDAEKVRSHLLAVHKYNLKDDLAGHVNPQRPTYALGAEGGLLLCSWPAGDKPSIPFIYSDEVWTGIEYQVASHLMTFGHIAEGLDIVRACRDRYDGRERNPFNEYECGHWYARAMSSYGLIQGLTGIRYDAVGRKLTVRPSLTGDFRSFLATATGYGTAGVKDGKPFVDVVAGEIAVDEIDYVPAS